MTAKVLMFMGTGSDVGKSLIVAGLCRLFANRGLRVAPFKPQNMSNNAAATNDGGEIGRAQALQARAAKIPASVHMNPVLLKPESETGAQIIVQGKRVATMKAAAFFQNRQQFMPAILESFAQVTANNDLVLVEGAGSPAETNLRQGDLANMGFAQRVGAPVILIGDIHRGGVIAALVGTHAVLDETDQNRIKAFLINKFHGDPNLFVEGSKSITDRTAWPSLGIVPHFPQANHLPAEDAVALENNLPAKNHGLEICVLKLPRIANFDDLDPLRLEPGVALRFLKNGEPLPASCDLLIIPGSKSTMADLAEIRRMGWDVDILAHARRGGKVLGLCGGYQMLGRMIHDPLGLEGLPASMQGLGLLDVETTLQGEKAVNPTQALHVASGKIITAYEIHLGQTTGPDTQRPFASKNGLPEGAINPAGNIVGTYLHGCFSGDAFRHAFLKTLGINSSSLAYDVLIDDTLNALAKHLEQSLDIDMLLALAEHPQ